MKKAKNNIAYLLFAFAMASLPMLWPQTISKAQHAASYKDESTDQRVDSINAEKNRTIDSALRIASTLPQMSVTLNKVIRSRKPVIKTKMLTPEVLIRFGGEIYEVDPEQYKGYLIVDYDKFLEQVDTGYIIINEFIDSPYVEVIKPPKNNWFQRIFSK